MLVSWLDYSGITGAENVLLGVDRGDGVLGTFVCAEPTGEPGGVPDPASRLEYYGAVGRENIRGGIDRGDGVVGTLICSPVVPPVNERPVEYCLATWQEYHGVTGAENIRFNVNRGDDAIGLRECNGDRGFVTFPQIPPTWLEYYGVADVRDVSAGVDRGDGQIGAMVCGPKIIEAGCLIETVVHDVIANIPQLVAMLPIDRWVTGAGHFNDEDPYCSINLESGEPGTRTNTIRIDEERVRFQMYFNDHAAGRRLQNTFVNAIDDLCYAFESDDGGKFVVLARVQNKIAIQEPTLVWQMLTDVIFWSE